MATKRKKKVYSFGEKKTENINGKELPVTFHTPKYKEAKRKASELLDSEEYKDVLEESDFWILVNTYANKTKAMYSGLIISHDGCLKINDALQEKMRFRPDCVLIDKDGYRNSLVYTYICPEQGLYEVGEVSDKNCKNDYPYAMAFKRCFDRVVLKLSKIAYSGIYSDSEADDFQKRDDEAQKETKKETETTQKEKAEETKEEINYRDKLVAYCKIQKIDLNEVAKEYKLNSKSTNEDFERVFKTLNETTKSEKGENE